MRKYLQGYCLIFILSCAPKSDLSLSHSEDNLFLANIVGGELVSGPEYEAVFSLNGCTATAISPRLLLTAAHCIAPNIVANFPMRVLLSNTSATRHRELNVKKTYIHPDYKVKKMADLALIEMKEDLTKKFKIKTFPSLYFASVEELKAIYEHETYFEAVGYGQTKSSSQSSKATDRPAKRAVDLLFLRFLKDYKTKQEWALSVIEKEDLSKNSYPDTFALSAQGKDTCNGDSGGPIFFNKEGRKYLFGVTIRGARHCASAKSPSYYRLIGGGELCVFASVLGLHNIELSPLCFESKADKEEASQKTQMFFKPNILIEYLD